MVSRDNLSDLARRLFALVVWMVATPAGAGTLSGQVTRSDTGAPLAGALVLVRGTSLFDQTGADGRFSILAPAGQFGLSCAAPGFAGSSTGALDLGPDVSRNFALEPAAGAEIRGQATCDGAACGGVLIQARQNDQTAGFTLSNASGAYRLAGLADASYTLRAISTRREVLEVAGLAASAATPLDVDLALTSNLAGYRLSGAVGLSDNPLDRSGSTVRVAGQPGVTPALTDASGLYRLEGVPPGLMSLGASRPGYEPRNQIDVLVRADRSYNWVLTKPSDPVDPVFRVSGTVRLREPETAETTTAAGCRVSVWSADGGPLAVRQVTATDAEGRYRIDGLPGGAYRAGAAREGYLEHLVEPFELGANRAQDFELTRDPDYDFGPGAADGELGCGCASGGDPARIVPLAVALLALLGRRGGAGGRKARC